MSLWIKFTERFPNANLSKFIKSYDNVQHHMGNGKSKDVFYSHGNFHLSLLLKANESGFGYCWVSI